MTRCLVHIVCLGFICYNSYLLSIILGPISIIVIYTDCHVHVISKMGKWLSQGSSFRSTETPNKHKQNGQL